MAEPYLGQITIFAGNFNPRGWAFCQGQLMSIAQNTALFSILGTTYGGDGRVTFGLPDLRGRVPIHPGQGPSLPNYTLGEQGGEATHTLIANEMPAHNHNVVVTSAAGTSQSPVGNILATDGAGGTAGFAAPGAGNGTLAPQSVSLAGANTPHNNMQPYLGLHYIIALEGIFPSRN